MVDSDALQVTRFVTNVLDGLDVPYVIGGSMASIVHEMLRTTMDVDIVADLKLFKEWAQKLVVADLMEQALEEMSTS